MAYSLSFLSILWLINISLFAQSFKVKATDVQKFLFSDKVTGNQIIFSSSTPLEDFTGTANSISGTVNYDNSNFAKSIWSRFTVLVSSINTGIELRNRHLQSANWLDAAKYPEILFELKSVLEIKQVNDNRISFKAIGTFTLHGVTKEIALDAEAIYLVENDKTRKRTPGDLLGISAKFTIILSEFNIDNSVIGNKVAEKIEVSINIVGSNKL